MQKLLHICLLKLFQTCLNFIGYNFLRTILQLAVEYESNAMIVKVDTDDEYEFARDMQVISHIPSILFFI